jgi:hypothetical protein
MSESSNAAPEVVPPTDAGVTSETHKMVKDENSSLREQVAALKAKQQVHDDRQREQLREMQPAVKSWIQEGIESAGDHKHEVAAMSAFGETLHEASNLDAAMPLARMITCHSLKIKREREEFSTGAATAEALGKANKELDELKSDRDQKASRIAELESLVAERTTAAEKLQAEMAKAGVLKDTFEFSNASARESSGQSTTGGSASSSAAASKSSFVDPLLNLVSSYGSANGRIRPTGSNHAILGSVGAEADVAAAIRLA